jgi:ABC-type branched-subunit amino acid transport system substrate-binding protein
MSDRRLLHFAQALLLLAVAGLAQDSAPKPYHDARRTPLSYNGPGRDDPEPTDVQEVRIGYFGPPDPSDEAGGQIWQGASLAVEEANRQGGYRGLPFRLIPAWDGNPWAGGVAKLARVVYSDKGWAIIGGIDGATTNLAEQVVAKAQLTLVSPAATDRSIHTASVPWMFSCAPGDQLLAAAVSQELRGRGGSFGLVSAIYHDSRAFAAQLKLAFVRDRLSPVLHLEWSGDTEDLTRIARELNAALPEAILVVAGTRESRALIKAIRDARFAGIAVYGPDLTLKLLKDGGEQTRLTTLKLIGGKDSPTYAVHATMKFVPPDLAFAIQDGLNIPFGKEDVSVFYPGPSQHPDKVAVYYPARKFLFGSCMILAGDSPGNTTEAEMDLWPVAIRRLEQFPVDVVDPGHRERLDPV